MRPGTETEQIAQIEGHERIRIYKRTFLELARAKLWDIKRQLFNIVNGLTRPSIGGRGALGETLV